VLPSTSSTKLLLLLEWCQSDEFFWCHRVVLKQQRFVSAYQVQVLVPGTLARVRTSYVSDSASPLFSISNRRMAKFEIPKKKLFQVMPCDIGIKVLAGAQIA
jgi:hypothetical protein